MLISGSPQTARSSWSHVNSAIDRCGTSAWMPQEMASAACLNSFNLNSNASSLHLSFVSYVTGIYCSLPSRALTSAPPGTSSTSLPAKSATEKVRPYVS